MATNRHESLLDPGGDGVDVEVEDAVADEREVAQVLEPAVMVEEQALAVIRKIRSLS